MFFLEGLMFACLVLVGEVVRVVVVLIHVGIAIRGGQAMETFLVQLRIVNLLVNFLVSFNLVVDLWYSSNFTLRYHI